MDMCTDFGNVSASQKICGTGGHSADCKDRLLYSFTELKTLKLILDQVRGELRRIWTNAAGPDGVFLKAEGMCWSSDRAAPTCLYEYEIEQGTDIMENIMPNSGS